MLSLQERLEDGAGQRVRRRLLTVLRVLGPALACEAAFATRSRWRGMCKGVSHEPRWRGMCKGVSPVSKLEPTGPATQALGTFPSRSLSRWVLPSFLRL